MWGDEVLERVRAIREAHAARFGFDLKAIVEDLRKREATCGHPVVQPDALSTSADAPNKSLHQTPRKAGALVS